MNLSASFLRWAKKKGKSRPPADVSFFDEFNDCAKSYPPSLRSGGTCSIAPSLDSPYTVSSELDAEAKNSQTHVWKEAGRAEPDAFVWPVHEGDQNTNVRLQTHPLGKQSLEVYGPPANILPGHPSGHPRPDLIHRYSFDHPPKVRPNISSVFSTPILPGSFVGSDQSNVHAIGRSFDASQCHDRSSPKRRSRETHSSVNLLNDSIAVRVRQLQSKSPSFPADRWARPPAKDRKHDIIGSPLSTLVCDRDTPVDASESVSLEDEGGEHLTSDFPLSLFPVPPTSPPIICKHPLPKPLVLCNKAQFPGSSASFTQDTTPPTTPTTPKSSQPHTARNPSSPTSILKKPPGGMGCESTINNSPSITLGSCAFRSMDSKLALSSRGPGLRLASSSSSLSSEFATTQRTTSSDSASTRPAQAMPHGARTGVRQRALSRPEVVTPYSLLTCDAYLNPRPAPKPCPSTAVEQVEWGYAV